VSDLSLVRFSVHTGLASVADPGRLKVGIGSLVELLGPRPKVSPEEVSADAASSSPSVSPTTKLTRCSSAEIFSPKIRRVSQVKGKSKKQQKETNLENKINQNNKLLPSNKVLKEFSLKTK